MKNRAGFKTNQKDGQRVEFFVPTSKQLYIPCCFYPVTGLPCTIISVETAYDRADSPEIFWSQAFNEGLIKIKKKYNFHKNVRFLSFPARIIQLPFCIFCLCFCKVAKMQQLDPLKNIYVRDEIMASRCKSCSRFFVSNV